MAKSKATKGDSKGAPIVTEEDEKQNTLSSPNYDKFKNMELPKLEPLVAEAVAAEVLRGLYVGHLQFFLKNKDVSTADKLLTKLECEQHEKTLDEMEKVIIYLDQTDKWLNDLHNGKFAEKPEDK